MALQGFLARLRGRFEERLCSVASGIGCLMIVAVPGDGIADRADCSNAAGYSRAPGNGRSVLSLTGVIRLLERSSDDARTRAAGRGRLPEL